MAEYDRLRPNRYIGLTWTEAGFHCDETAAFDAMLATIAARRSFENFICQIDDHDRRRYRRVSGRPVMAVDGRFLGYRGIAADISAEIQSHAAADHARATLLDAIESISEGFILLDSDDRFVLCNERARELIGHSGPLIAGMSFEEILRRGVTSGHIDTDLPVDVFIADRLRRHRQAEGTSEQRLHDGRWFRISERRTSDGGTVIVQADITADRQQAAALAKQIITLQATSDAMADAKDQAETANRSKSEFLANMGHELRTPLNAIIGFSEMIRDQLIGPVGEHRYIEYAKDINDSGHHLLSLINDLLDLSKAEAGKFVLNDEAVDIAALLDTCLKLVQLDAFQDEVTLYLTVPPLPPLRADPRLLKQVMINLLANAEKFTPAGGRIDIDAALQKDGGCLIRVRDTGVGMAAQDIPRALEAFTQLESPPIARRPGTGLGLPLSKRLVELHGGHLRIDSARGQGTTVSVLLPPERVLRDQPPYAGIERGRSAAETPPGPVAIIVNRGV